MTTGPPKQKTTRVTRSGMVPRGVWALGFVSLFMDTSTEMVNSLMPVFLVSVLGASALTVGLIEGIAEATALITKIFSGVLSDWLGRRKLLAVIGYGLAAFTKPVFPLANSVGWVMTARVIDRVGKGIRGAPRDALVGDITPVNLRGASYGLRQSLDTVGAFAGPLLAIAFMAFLANDIRAVFWFAVIPAFIAVGLLIIFVKDPKQTPPEERIHTPIRTADLRHLGRAYWWIVVVGGVLTLARFSEAFLVLRAEDIGLPLMLIPLVLVVMNIAYAVTSYPAGRLSDRFGRRYLVGAGFVVLVIADLILATAAGIWQVMVGIVLWGVHMGLTHGVLAALVADTAPPHLRGTAFGVYNLVSGVSLLIASVLAGWLWDQYGAQAAFFAGASIAMTSLLGLLVMRRLQVS